jgi:hypothetical protein
MTRVRAGLRAGDVGPGATSGPTAGFPACGAAALAGVHTRAVGPPLAGEGGGGTLGGVAGANDADDAVLRRRQRCGALCRPSALRRMAWAGSGAASGGRRPGLRGGVCPPPPSRLRPETPEPAAPAAPCGRGGSGGSRRIEWWWVRRGLGREEWRRGRRGTDDAEEMGGRESQVRKLGAI